MQIRVLVPVLYSPELADKALAEYCAAAGAGVEISTACVANGTGTIESDYDIALAGPETARLALAAEAEGVDACTIACFSDPGCEAAREAVSIPVIGEGQAALQLACLLGSRIAIITTWEQCIPRMRRLAARSGHGHRLASVRATGVGVMDLAHDSVARIVAESVAAVKEDGAEVVLLGCTGTGELLGEAVQREVSAALGAYVPVIDPVKAALKLAEACVAAGMSHSKAAYPGPPSARPEYVFARAS